jgi:hypothetical protein
MADRTEPPTASPASAASLVAFLRLLARCIDEEADSLEADPGAMADVLGAYRAELIKWGLRTALLDLGVGAAEN